MIIDTDKLKYKIGDVFWTMSNNRPEKVHIVRIILDYDIDLHDYEHLSLIYYDNNSNHYTESMLGKLSRTKEELCKQIFKTDE